MCKFYEIEIGSAPADESCAQVGDENYSSQSRKECAAFKVQILRHYPIPEGIEAGVRICVSPHDFGSYREVFVTYKDQPGFDWALSVESDIKKVLNHWDELAMEDLGLIAT